MPDGNDEDRELWRRLAATRQPPEDSTCPDEGALAAFLDGRASAGERARLEAHLAVCPRCLAAVAETARIEQAPLVPVSDVLLRRLQGLVAAETGQGRGRAPAVPARRSFLGPLPAWMALAAALALTCWTGFALGGRAVPDASRLRDRAVGEISFGLGDALALPGDPEPFPPVNAR